jgi:hypothetical protein
MASSSKSATSTVQTMIRKAKIPRKWHSKFYMHDSCLLTPKATNRESYHAIESKHILDWKQSQTHTKSDSSKIFHFFVLWLKAKHKVGPQELNCRHISKKKRPIPGAGEACCHIRTPILAKKSELGYLHEDYERCHPHWRTQMSPVRIKQGWAGEVAPKMARTASFLSVSSTTDLKPKNPMPKAGQCGLWNSAKMMVAAPREPEKRGDQSPIDHEKDHPLQLFPGYPTTSQRQICWPKRLSYWVHLTLASLCCITKGKVQNLTRFATTTYQPSS